MKDPFGMVLALLKADTTVLSIVGSETKVSSVFTSAPCVVLTDLTTTRRPYGPGSGRVGHQMVPYVAKCYGTDTATGAITARQLAGAVSDGMHNHSPYAGTSSRVLVKAYAPDIAGMSRDPDTKQPHYDVRIDAYAIA